MQRRTASEETAVWRQEVRGSYPDPRKIALSGRQRLETWRQGLTPLPPLTHLTGARPTGFGSGTAEAEMPASGWLAAPNGLITGGKPEIGLGAIGALPVGLLVFAIGLSLGGTTGYAINPARDLGPRIAHFLLPIPNKRDSDWSYAWIPVVAPICGGLLAALIARGLHL